MGRGKHRDYLVKTAAGGVLWRNRRFLRIIPTPGLQQQISDFNHTSVAPATSDDNQFFDVLQPSTHRNAPQSAPRRSSRLANRP